MIAAGVNAKALSTYMGHASVTITFDRYGHLMPGKRGRSGEAAGSLLERAAPSVREEAASVTAATRFPSSFPPEAACAG